MADRTDKTRIAAAATRFMARYGEQAAIEAAQREHELQSAGDIEGAIRWRLIRREIIARRGPPKLRPAT